MTKNVRALEDWEGSGADPALADIVVVLDETQDLVNIAGVVRAMRNMGLSRLRLVNPVEFDPWRITGIAHRCDAIVESAQIVESLDAALADTVWVVGTSNRGRTAQRNYVRPREHAPEILQRTREGTVALLFGREDRGLSNEALDRCHAVAVIPADPDYSSLNLAQAFLILGYELFMAAGGGGTPLPRGRRAGPPATHDQLEQMYAALEDGLHRINFFRARAPDGVMRTLRTLLGRAEPDLQEAGVIRALGYGIGKHLDFLMREGGQAVPGEGGGAFPSVPEE
jgi:TrmH family RNA methyltransferase